MPASRLDALAAYSACDVSDALLKLHVPGAGFLTDIGPIHRTQAADQHPSHPPRKTIARASTVLFVPQSSPSFPDPSDTSTSITSIIKSTLTLPATNIPPGTPYADLTIPDTIVVISQPHGQRCAVVGGIIAMRMKVLGARGVVVDGRVRDLGVVGGGIGIPVWSRGTSTVGAGAEAKAWAHNVPITIDGVHVSPGDVVMLDSYENGAVCIPAEKLDDVLELLPKLTAADARVMADVQAGVDVKEAFARHRT